MKKLLTILLSLVLVFCFISCSQPSNNPEDQPLNVPSIEKDPNVPASFTAKLEENDAKMISDVIYKFAHSKSRTIISDSISSTSYSFKEGARIDDIAVSGTLSIDMKVFYDTKKEERNASFTSNGNVEIGETKYALSNVVYSYTDDMGIYKITGTITKDGESIDISSIEKKEPILFKLIANRNGVMEDTAIVNTQTGAYGVYYNVNADDVEGEFSTIISITKEAQGAEITVNLKKVKIGVTEHKLTASFTATRTYGSKDIDFDIAYLSIDGKYFTIDSIEKNSNVLEALANFLG